jgi:hypothetical protein
MKNAVFWDVAPCRSCVMEAILPPKRRFTQDLHGATSQNTAFFSEGIYSIDLFRCTKDIFTVHIQINTYKS